jgi:hypothetical protein
LHHYAIEQTAQQQMKVTAILLWRISGTRRRFEVKSGRHMSAKRYTMLSQNRWWYIQRLFNQKNWV